MTYSPNGKPVSFQLMPFTKDDIPNGCKIYKKDELTYYQLCLIRDDKKIIIPPYYARALEKVTQDDFNIAKWDMNVRPNRSHK